MKEIIFNTIDDLISDFIYYDRKEDDELPRGKIEETIKKGDVTKEEIINEFVRILNECL
jgi:hypothetical protein